MVYVYMPVYFDTIHPTLLLVSMHVVLWNCFHNCIKSPLLDPLAWVLSFLCGWGALNLLSAFIQH